MSLDSSIHGQATAVDEIASTAVRLPRDILAIILLRLPASDLRRFGRVCKEWRDVISDPIFLEAHQVQGPRALTHTIVFVSSFEQHTGRGFLFDEHWRLTATFAAGESESMVGTCNGLLFFLDVRLGAINYKIVHQAAYGYFIPAEQVLAHVYTIGGDETWRSLQLTGVMPRQSYGRPVCAGGAVYWLVIGTDSKWMFARFDPSTEEITTHLVEMSRQISLIEWDACVFLTAFRMLGELRVLLIGEGDCWVYKYNGDAVKLPHRRWPTLSQALQRGHLLLEDSDGGLYAHLIGPSGHDLDSGKLLLKRGNMEEQGELAKNADLNTSCDTRGLFVPVLFNQEPAAVVRVPHMKGRARAFGYVPPVSPAPLAHYFGKL
ncbi:unnamed protein product [Alopecurus aequalis]